MVDQVRKKKSQGENANHLKEMKEKNFVEGKIEGFRMGFAKANQKNRIIAFLVGLVLGCLLTLV